MQSAGGIISSGIALHNYLRTLPISIAAYNGGTVSSIAILAFLAAKERHASKTATFMLHKGTAAPSPGINAERLALFGKEVAANDERIESIWKQHIRLTDEQLEIHKRLDLVLSASEAKRAGLIHEIADFSPPPGAPIINIRPNQK